jgi:hypothetical protein
LNLVMNTSAAILDVLSKKLHGSKWRRFECY